MSWRHQFAPTYAPELNAIERVWQHLRVRYLAGRLFRNARYLLIGYGPGTAEHRWKPAAVLLEAVAQLPATPICPNERECHHPRLRLQRIAHRVDRVEKCLFLVEIG